MKKINLLALLVCCPALMFGQLTVQPDGKVEIGNSLSVSYRADGPPVGSNEDVALRGHVHTYIESNQVAVGVDGYVDSYANGALVGVRGIATTYPPNGSVKNFGVYGRSGGSMPGVAIFGTVGSGYPSFSESYAGYFRGKVTITNELNVPVVTYNSDYRYKQNVTELGSSTTLRGKNPVANLLNLNPVEYNLKQVYKSDIDSMGNAVEVGYFDEESPMYQRRHYGLIAQEVQKIYPDLVYEDGDGYLSIDYIGIIPLLIQTVKEQNARIEHLETTCCAGNTLFNAKAKQSADALTEEDAQAAALYQNVPNPFSQSTEISYYLPASVSAAVLCIYDMNGRQLKQISIAERGNGSQTISGASLSAGIYLYALIADGEEVDVKRMILTE